MNRRCKSCQWSVVSGQWSILPASRFPWRFSIEKRKTKNEKRGLFSLPCPCLRPLGPGLRQKNGAPGAGQDPAGAGAGVSLGPGRGLAGLDVAFAPGQSPGAAVDPSAGLPGLSGRGQGVLAGGPLPQHRFRPLCRHRPGLSPEGEVHGEALLFRDRDLVPDHRYYYRVAAYDQDGYLGGWSPTLNRVWGWLAL